MWRQILHWFGFCQAEQVSSIGRTDRWRCAICGETYLEDEDGLR